MTNSLDYHLPQTYTQDMTSDQVRREVRTLNAETLHACKTHDYRSLIRLMLTYDMLSPFIQEQGFLAIAESDRQSAEKAFQEIKSKIQDFFLMYKWK